MTVTTSTVLVATFIFHFRHVWIVQSQQNEKKRLRINWPTPEKTGRTLCHISNCNLSLEFLPSLRLQSRELTGKLLYMKINASRRAKKVYVKIWEINAPEKYNQINETGKLMCERNYVLSMQNQNNPNMCNEQCDKTRCTTRARQMSNSTNRKFNRHNFFFGLFFALSFSASGSAFVLSFNHKFHVM